MFPNEPSGSPLPVIEVLPFALDSSCPLPLALAEGWLGAAERGRADRFRYPHLRDRYIRGRGMMRGMLGRRLGCEPETLEFIEGERGKPSLAGGTTLLGFNLSHSEDEAVLAVGPLADIGVDIERVERSADLDGLARRCFNESEIAWMEAQGGERKAEVFFWIWTAKEARMKASGEGFQLEPKRILLEFEGERPVRYRRPESPAAHLATLETGRGTVCCVAAFAPFRIERIDSPDWSAGG